MVQSGRLAAFATAAVGSSGVVINSAPLTWDIAPAHNVRAETVIPTAIAIPLIVVAGSAALWRRRLTTTR
jgi:hypothetical protein